MIVVRFGVEDVAATRFAISPLWETVASRWAVNSPERHVVHLSWTKKARALQCRGDLARHAAVLDGVIRPRAWMPDFITPLPFGPLVRVEDELERVRATPSDVVRADLAATTPRMPLSPVGQALADDPERMLPRFVDALAAWWREAVAPDWARMRTLLEADISYRARTLADHGPAALFESLHPSLTWRDRELVQESRLDQVIELDGSGLPLMPSVFLDRAPVGVVRPDSRAGLVYPARAVGTLWERPRRRTRAPLARLLGASRARLLTLLVTPHTTSQLARRSGLAPGGVSAHLAVLVDAGLVTRSRQGREVVYLANEAGRSLLDASG